MFSVLAVQPQQSLSVITRASFYAKFVQCLPTKTCIPIPVIISLFTLSLVTPFPFSQLEITNSITVRLKLFFLHRNYKRCQKNWVRTLSEVFFCRCSPQLEIIYISHEPSERGRTQDSQSTTANSPAAFFTSPQIGAVGQHKAFVLGSCIYTCNSFHCCLEKLMSKTTVDHQPLKNRSFYDV